MATRTSNYQVWNEATFEWDGHLFVPAPHNHSAAEITSGTLGVDRIPTLDYLPLSGGSLTGNINTTTQSTAYTIENVVKFSTTSTPVQTVIYTGIKYLSSTHMPVVRIYGYAYGLNSPIELKIGFYIYGGNLGWAGAVSMGAWRPGIYLFKYNSGGTDYVAIGLSGSCYYLAFQVDVQSVNFSGSIGSSILATGWAANSKTQAEVDAGGAIIPAVGTNNCILVAYKSTLAPLTVQRNGVTLDAYDGSTSKTINIVDSDLDTKNTAGATDTSSKIFLIGAVSQDANPQTFSHNTVYVGVDGCLYSNGTKVSVEGHTHSEYITATEAYQDFERAFTKGTAFNKNFGTGSTDVAQGDHTHTASQVGALPSSGGTLSGDLIFDVGDVDRFIKFNYTGGSAGYGWRIGYLGSGSGDANYLSFQTEQTADNNWAEVLRFGLTSKVGTFAVTPKVGITNVSLEGHIHGNLTSDGKLGGNAYRPVITDLMGKISEGAFATQAEAQAGTSETVFMNPKRVHEAISYLMPSGGVSVSSIKNWTNYVTCTGATGASLPITANPTVGYIGLVWSFASTSAHVRNITWVKIGAVDATFKIGASGIPSTSGSTYTELYRFRIYGETTSSMKVDWVYKHTINDTAAEAHPIAAATIYVWDVLQML